MSERTRGPVHSSPPGDDDEALLARYLESDSERGAAAVDELCAGDPERSARLRARIARLEGLGLLGGGGSNDLPASIGPHRVLGVLGQGGMGTVYLGVDGGDGRKVAIKIAHAPLPAPGSGDPGGRARARFEREIRAVAQLEHPSIVTIHEVGESGGRPYFTMEFVEGATLARIVEELRERRVAFEQLTGELLREIVESASPAGGEAGGRAPASEAAWGRTYVEIVCRWVIEIADALAHAHAHAIVHRDVKPSNVIVGRDGHAKLFDLGLARVGDQPALTRSGDLAGSPYYMSPEQVSGPHERVDRRTDVYSLGVTLYELLTLRRPFEGPTSAHVFRQIASREPPLPRRQNPLVPRDLETICLTALEKDPERRYPSMEELAADLRRFLAFQPVRAKPASLARRAQRFARRNPALASAQVLGGLVLVGLPIGLLWANSAVRAQERRAAREADLKSRVTAFLIDQFRLTEAEREQGATISARELLDRGVERLEGAFEDDPLVRAELFAATGTVYRNLGLFDRAIPLLDRAVAIRQSTPNDDPRALAGLLNALAGAHLGAGHPETARRLCLRGLGLLDAPHRDDPTIAVELHRTLAEAAGLMGESDEAERSLTLALGILRSASGAMESDTAAVLEALGGVAMERGEHARAREHYLGALAVHRKAWAPDVGAIARVTAAIARADEARGEHELAAAGRREAARYAGAPAPEARVARLPFVVEGPSKPEYERSFQAGITALQSRELGRAIDAFERCIELDPGRSVCAYNIACGYALSGDVERGLEWLARAADMGFGVAEYRLRVAETDSEIASLRADPRGRATLERMRLHAERVRAYAREPRVVLPASHAPAEPCPLLVVLHAEGATKLDVASGPWARLAGEFGAALLAPSGSIPTGVEPEQGMTWLEDPSDLVRKPVAIERDVGDAVRRFLAEHAVDRDRVWIAGEGLGAMVAFDVALRAPGLFKAVLLVDGPIHPDTPLDRARRAASLGLRVAYVCDDRSADVAEPVERWLRACGFAEPQVRGPAEGAGADRADVLRAALAAW